MEVQMHQAPVNTPHDDRYKKLFSEMVDGFALHEAVRDDHGVIRDFRFLEVNHSFERITSLTSSAIVGRTVCDIFPNTNPFLMAKFESVVSSGEPLTFERYSIDLGTHLKITAYRPAPELLVCVVTDISDRKKIEEQLLESEQRYRELAEKANTIIIRWNTDGIVTYINEFGEKLFGYNRNELIGRHLVGTVVPAAEISGRGLSSLTQEFALSPEKFK